jgi:hypothetical protein
MANGLYDKGRERFLTGVIDWTSATIRCSLIDTGAYTVSLSSHEFLSDIAGGAIIAGPATLGSKTATNGAADAADVTFTAVTGTSIEGIVIYMHVTVSSDSPLLAWIDVATGLPITPNGGDIIVTWDNGTNKIFKL